MAEYQIPNLKSSARHYLLPDRLPEITELHPVQLKNINRDIKHYFKPDFFYSGSAFLSPMGKALASRVREAAGKCLGGGVLASRDLEWISEGRQGTKPGQFVPLKTFFGYSKEPQSYLPSEWIAFEYGLMLNPPTGGALLNKWDEIDAITLTFKQGRDFHIRIDGKFAGVETQINAQANSSGINTLLDIAQNVGVPLRR